MDIRPLLHPWIVEPSELAEHIGAGFVDAAIVTMVNLFVFEHSEEALNSCIVAVVAHSTHAAHQVVPSQELLVLLGWPMAGSPPCKMAGLGNT